MRKDSLDMTDEDRHLVVSTVKEAAEQFIIITHGTDTMIETARLLAASVSEKSIVLTGAMQPAGFRSSDALFNVGVAVGAVCSSPPGVYIAMSGQIFNPASTRKNRERGVFESVE